MKERVEDKQKEREKDKEKKPKDDQPPRPRPLHRTCSLFMRSIAPTISKAEIVAVSVCITCECVFFSLSGGDDFLLFFVTALSALSGIYACVFVRTAARAQVRDRQSFICRVCAIEFILLTSQLLYLFLSFYFCVLQVFQTLLGDF